VLYQVEQGLALEERLTLARLQLVDARGLEPALAATRQTPALPEARVADAVDLDQVAGAQLQLAGARRPEGLAADVGAAGRGGVGAAPRARVLDVGRAGDVGEGGGAEAVVVRGDGSGARGRRRGAFTVVVVVVVGHGRCCCSFGVVGSHVDTGIVVSVL